jgi:hypothetical protein
MKFSKAQGMSMNVIIIAALAIIVLIILVVVMTGKFNLFGTTTRSCSAQGGECKEECGDGEAKMHFTDCKDINEDLPVCCISTYKPFEEQQERDPNAQEE